MIFTLICSYLIDKISSQLSEVDKVRVADGDLLTLVRKRLKPLEMELKKTVYEVDGKE